MEIHRFDQYVEQLNSIVKKMQIELIDEVIRFFISAYQNDRQIFFFGNGGSGALASHFCEDLGKGTISDLNLKKRFRVISLTDNTPYILAWANDFGYETIFEQQLRNLAREKDVAVGISCSGQSENVVRALNFGKSIDMLTIGLTGYDGGKVGRIVDCNIHVPSFDMGVVESVYSVLVHYIVAVIKERIKKELPHG